jgi:hypothetical protein
VIISATASALPPTAACSTTSLYHGHDVKVDVGAARDRITSDE